MEMAKNHVHKSLIYRNKYVLYIQRNHVAKYLNAVRTLALSFPQDSIKMHFQSTMNSIIQMMNKTSQANTINTRDCHTPSIATQ